MFGNNITKVVKQDDIKIRISSSKYIRQPWTSVVQPCRHSPHVATSILNVATTTISSFSYFRLFFKKNGEIAMFHNEILP